jgi:hypothetical protein
MIATLLPCDQIQKKIRVGENGGLNQSKHQNSTIQVPRLFFKLIARYYTFGQYCGIYTGCPNIIKTLKLCFFLMEPTQFDIIFEFYAKL